MCKNTINQEFQLLQAKQEDFQRLTAFYRDAIDNTPDMAAYGRWIYGLHPTDEMIMGHIQSNAMYYCLLDGQIVCALGLTLSQGEDYHEACWEQELNDDQVAVVHLLCVNPRYQHRGIGRKAMELAEELARKEGKKALRLDALACNAPAHRLYESLGFQKRGTAHWFADNVGWTDFYLFERIL